jgi:DNA-binding CsgD family transcriptional regulator
MEQIYILCKKKWGSPFKTFGGQNNRADFFGLWGGCLDRGRSLKVNIIINFEGMKQRKLTPREHQILELTAWGNSQKEIAYELDLRVRTIDTHLKNIKGKTGLQKATELECAFFIKKCHVPVIDIPEKYRARIATALLALSIFTAVFHTTDMLRVFRGNMRPGAKTVNVRPGTRRNRKERETAILFV